ncbi:hypothetical protein [Paracoccus sp. SM22M-07]|uniref:phage upper tail fiber protein n=1 Tax=Paracoccus sp. SM22M-07 TaxID=1520813 RepID=UPI000931E519|nr:hypothetical protein [Paracoccus sp. SM22M-07]
MPISQQTITGSVKTPANADAPITGVTFTLVGSDFEAGEIIAVRPEQGAVTTETGDFEITVWPNNMGMKGNTHYKMSYTFSDATKVTMDDKIYVTKGEGPVTIEDIAFDTIARGAVKPYALTIVTQAQYDGLATKAANTVYLVRG